MSGSNYRHRNPKQNDAHRETDPNMRELFLRIYRSGYKQGAIDNFNGDIKVARDEYGYVLKTKDE